MIEDGLSLYKLNDRGFVCEHIVVRVVPPKTRSFAHVLSWFSQLVVPPVPAGATTSHYEVEVSSTAEDSVTSESNTPS